MKKYLWILVGLFVLFFALSALAEKRLWKGRHCVWNSDGSCDCQLGWVPGQVKCDDIAW